MFLIAMSDALIAPVWLGVNLLLVWTAWSWVRWVFSSDSPLAQVAHTIIVCWAAIVVSGLLLGSLRVLSGWALLLTVAGGAVLTLTLVHRRRLGRGSGGWQPEMPRAVVEPAGAGDQLPRDRGNSKPEAAESGHRLTRSERWWLTLWGALWAFWLARIVFDGLLRLPTDWDSLMYHIPLIDQWLRASSLYAPDDAFWYNPGNNELLGLWLVAPFSGDFLIGLNNLPAAILLSVGAIELAAGAGLARPTAHLVGLATVSTWPVLRQLADAENDIAVAGLFLTGLGYVLRHVRAGRLADLAFASVTLGLLAGVKYYALGYVAVAGIALILMTGAVRGLRPAVRVIPLLLLGLLLWSGYWYLRNLILTGTPIYPKGFTPAADLWSQMRPGSWTSTLLGSGRSEVWPLALDCVAAMAGPCHWLAVCSLPVCLVWLVTSGLWLRAQQQVVEGTIRLGLAFLLATSGLLLVTTPNTVETSPGTMNMLLGQYLPVRFGLCFLSLAVLGLALVLQDGSRLLGSWMRRRWATISTRHPKPGLVRRFLQAALASRTFWYAIYLGPGLLILYQLGHLLEQRLRRDLVDWLLLAINLLIVTHILILCFKEWPKWRRSLVTALGAVTLLGMTWACAWLGARWHERFAAHYNGRFSVGLFNAVAEMDPASARLCVCEYRYYPFFGSKRQFPVCRPLWVPTYDRFLEYLRQHEVTCVVTRTDDPFPQHRYEGVKTWLSAHPDLFHSPLEDGPYLLVQVNRDLLATLTEPSARASRSARP
jgi:hypothetical protein